MFGVIGFAIVRIPFFRFRVPHPERITDKVGIEPSSEENRAPVGRIILPSVYQDSIRKTIPGHVPVFGDAQSKQLSGLPESARPRRLRNLGAGLLRIPVKAEPSRVPDLFPAGGVRRD